MDKKRSQSVAIDTVPLPERTVRVSLPASVAYDLSAFQEAQASILGRLGCAACCSGWDISFDVIRSFAVDEKLRIRDLVAGGFTPEG